MNDRPPDLFDNLPTAPYVHGSDTSRDAAVAIRDHLTRLERVVLEAITTAGSAGACNHELEGALGMSGNTVRPRVVDLVRKGKVRDSGKRRLTKSGRRAVVWEVTCTTTV